MRSSANRGSTSETQVEKEEFSGTGEAAAVSGTNLVPVCDISNVMDCQVYACPSADRFDSCVIASQAKISNRYIYGWYRDSNSAGRTGLADKSTVSSDGIRFSRQIESTEESVAIFFTREIGSYNEYRRYLFTPKLTVVQPSKLPRETSGVILEVTWSKMSSEVENVSLEFAGQKSGPISGWNSSSTKYTLPSISTAAGSTAKFAVTLHLPADTKNSGKRLISFTPELSVVEKASVTSSPTPTATPTPRPTPSILYAFVTSETFNGDLLTKGGEIPSTGPYVGYPRYTGIKGYEAADFLCNRAARRAAGTLYADEATYGKFRAVISTSESNAVSRVTRYNSVPLRSKYGTGASEHTIVSNSVNLFGSPTIDGAWLYDESGASTAPAGGPFDTWSGTDQFGEVNSAHCSEWTSSLGITMGVGGRSSLTDTQWVAFFTSSCSDTYHLYCIGGHP